MDHGIAGTPGLTAAYLHYQLRSAGCAAQLHCAGRRGLEGWSIYDGRGDMDRSRLWIVPRQELPARPAPGHEAVSRAGPHLYRLCSGHSKKAA